MGLRFARFRLFDLLVSEKLNYGTLSRFYSVWGDLACWGACVVRHEREVPKNLKVVTIVLRCTSRPPSPLLLLNTTSNGISTHLGLGLPFIPWEFGIVPFG